jgi:cytochrome c oxidase cbb3-type subunit 4
MEVLDLYALVSSVWVLWFMAVFVGIVIWAMWPGRRNVLEQHGHIPLKDGD